MSVMPPIWRTRATTPEQHLAAAILTQAFADMFLLSNHDVARVDTEAVQAMRYLTDRHGQSAHWRNKWCSYLDLDGDLLAVRVRMILDGEIDAPGDDHFANRLDRARDRWSRLAHAPKPKRVLNAPPTPPLPPLPPLPRIVPKVDHAAIAKAKVYALLHEPKRQIDILEALADDMSHHTVMLILNEGIATGEVIRRQDRKYHLLP